MSNTENRKRRKQRRKRKKHTVLKVFLILFLFLLVSAGAGIYLFNAYAEDIIEENAIQDLDTDNIYNVMYQKSTICDGEGNEIDALYLSGGNRTLISYNDIPQDLINAVVDTEDKTFWEHEGFNYVRMLGAIKERILGGGQISGTSTITQQLARNLYLAETKSERTLSRKILEAYYTRILEEELSKEKILEIYFNTVYFGFNSYGIEAASQSYFSKEPKDLDLLECAALAALPQAPDSYALIKSAYSQDEEELPVIEKGNGFVYLYNGNASENRRKIILDNMKEAGHITAKEYNAALAQSLEGRIKINTGKDPGSYSYYIDCAIEEAVGDLAERYGVTEEEARSMIYTKGYHIYTCLDRKVQDTLDKQINKDSNYAAISYINKDGNGNIISSSGAVLMRPYQTYFDDDGNFTLTKGEFTKGDDGTITLKKGKRLDFYAVSAGDSEYVSVEFKGLYKQDDGALYFIEGGSLSIPAGYTSFDGDGNCVIAAKFREDFPAFFKEGDGKLTVSKDNYQTGQKMRQPQAAAVIIDNETGRVAAMTGGRGARGKQLYNRATSPRQPGSSIKPLAAYGPALQQSAELAKQGEKPSLKVIGNDNWGDYITAGSIIDDAPLKLNGKTWPRNDSGGYGGPMTLRKAVQQSVNVVAVKVFRQVGIDYSIEMLQKVGISSLVLEGEPNDKHDALTLGGMTKGVSPLEMTAAYATFASGGTYREPIFYTQVTDASGQSVLENVQEEERVYDDSVAWIMTDVLKSAVLYGTGKNAQVDGWDVAGKTGTTSSKYDIWFSGFTPRYTMALWMGSDVNIALANYSSAAAAFWSHIMTAVSEGLPGEHFSSMPPSVVKVDGEYYAIGTEPPEPAEEETSETRTDENGNPITTDPATRPDDDDESDDDDDSDDDDYEIY